LRPGQAAYNLVAAFEMRGAVRWEVFQKAVDALVARHESLRTSFAAREGQPVQIIHPAAEVPVVITSLVGQADAEATARHLSAAEAATPFDLSTAPLMRVRVFTIEPHRHLLVLTVHHIVFDGWSVAIAFEELGALYAAMCEGRDADLPAVPIQYADFTLWQQKRLTPQRTTAQLDYWKTALADLPDTIDFNGRPRPATPSGRGAVIHRTLDADATSALRLLCRNENVTMFMVFVAALDVLLHRQTGGHDFLIGAPIAIRPRQELERTLGFFANTVVVRANVSGNPTFREVLARVKASALGAYAHQDVAFSEVVQAVKPERSTGFVPLFQVMCAAQRVPDQLLVLPDIDVQPLHLGTGTAKFDLLLDVQERSTEIDLAFEYSVDTLDVHECEQWMARLVMVVTAAAAAPESAIGDLDVLTPLDRTRLATWNQTTVIRNPDTTVVSLFTMQAAAMPAATALSFGADRLSYEALDRRSNQVARALIARGVRPGDRVALCLERSLWLPVALLGVLKAGAAYVPLDPGYPVDRLRFMLQDADVRVLLATEATMAEVIGSLDDPRAFPGWAEESSTCLAAAPDVQLSATDACYVMYTSGSTGQPKGVVMPHGALANLVEWQRARSEGAPTTLQYSALSFDVSFQEHFSTWASGGHLVLIPEAARRDSHHLLRIIQDSAVERLFLPVVALQMLAETAVDIGTMPPSLREVVTAGEQLRVTPAIRRWFSGLDHARLDNQYGPTETHVVTAHMLTGPPDLWPELPPIGTPIDNVRVHLLDDALRPAPVGAPAELWVEGIALASGYHRRPEMTADRFRTARVGARDVPLYRTGDAARQAPDGTLVFLGRRDDQVKIRGFRVEPGEVETVIEHCPGVRRAAVVARPGAAGLRLVAFYVAAAAPGTSSDEIRQFLQARMPDYLVPSAIVPLAELPLTPSGKIDRRRLPETEALPERTDYLEPRDEVERAIAAIWAEVLGVPRVGVNDDFFELGGHSILAGRVTSRLRKVLGVEISFGDIFEATTLAGLAGVVRGRQPQSPAAPSPITRAVRRTRTASPEGVPNTDAPDRTGP
jgi:amino acid adenylation domain-containing protein